MVDEVLDKSSLLVATAPGLVTALGGVPTPPKACLFASSAKQQARIGGPVSLRGSDTLVVDFAEIAFSHAGEEGGEGGIPRLWGVRGSGGPPVGS
jgi:hypothetical protein